MIDDVLTVDNDGAHPLQSGDSFDVWLTGARFHQLRVRWYNVSSGYNLFLQWRQPQTGVFVAVPAQSVFCGLT